MRMFRKWIEKFWAPKPTFDWLETHYQLMADGIADGINQEELDALIAKRDLAKKRKKKGSHIQRDIELHRAAMMRSK